MKKFLFKIAELAGHTNRVYTMLHVFDECAHERYQRIPMVKEEHGSNGIKRKVELDQQEFLTKGQIIESNEDIIAENVPIITPNGDVIVESLSLKVKLSNEYTQNISIFLLDYPSYACSYHRT
jgi:ABC-type uncharacterized transport system fused permease/ATPase subunit